MNGQPTALPALVIVLFSLLFSLTGCPDQAPPAEASGQRPAQVVTTESIGKGPLRQRLSFPAELVPRQSVELTFPFPGRLERIRVELGDQVKAGNLLAQLDERPLRVKLAEASARAAVTKAAIKRAEADFRSIEVEWRRKAPLAEKQLVTAQEMDQLKSRRESAEAALEVARAQAQESRAQLSTIQQQLTDARLKAPFAGAVDERLSEPGAVVGPNVPVLRLVHSQPAVARFQVGELHLDRLGPVLPARPSSESPRPPGKVTLEVQAYPSRRFEGQLARLGPALDPSNRAVKVEAEFDNAEGTLMPGMYGRVTIDLGGRAAVVRVPLRALIELDRDNRVSETERAGDLPRRPGIFVVRDNKAHTREVAIGITDRIHGEVLDGLAEGDVVVVSGQHALRDGQPVRPVPASPADDRGVSGPLTDGGATPR